MSKDNVYRFWSQRQDPNNSTEFHLSGFIDPEEYAAGFPEHEPCFHEVLPLHWLDITEFQRLVMESSDLPDSADDIKKAQLCCYDYLFRINKNGSLMLWKMQVLTIIDKF